MTWESSWVKQQKLTFLVGPIPSVMQEIVFDLENRKVGIAPAKCLHPKRTQPICLHPNAILVLRSGAQRSPLPHPGVGAECMIGLKGVSSGCFRMMQDMMARGFQLICQVAGLKVWWNHVQDSCNHTQHDQSNNLHSCNDGSRNHKSDHGHCHSSSRRNDKHFNSGIKHRGLGLRMPEFLF